MTTRNLARLSLPPRGPLVGQGHELAIEMLDELGDADSPTADQSCLDPQYRRTQPYRNIVLEYLERAREAGPAVEQGFTMILSDLVAALAQGACPDVEFYDKMVAAGVISAAAEESVGGD